jgi:hypothetical protein
MLAVRRSKLEPKEGSSDEVRATRNDQLYSLSGTRWTVRSTDLKMTDR